MIKKFDEFLDSRWALWLLAALALVTRIVGAVMGGTGGKRGDDDGMHLSMALNFLSGKGLSMEWQELGRNYTFQPPGMPVIHLIFLQIFQDFWLAERVFFVLMSTACFTLFYSLAREYFDRRVAYISALILILYPPQWFWSTRVNSHTFATNMIMPAFLLLMIAWRRKSVFLHFVVGVIWALMGLMRPEYLLGVFCMAVATFFSFRRRGESFTRPILFLLVGWTLAVSPWVIRNYMRVNRFVLSSSHYSYNLWLVFNPEYDYSGVTYSGPPELVERLRNTTNEMERVDIWVAEAKKFIRENPQIAVERVIGNVANFWRPWLSFDAIPLRDNLIYIFSWGPIFVLFLGGLFLIPWKDPKWIAIWFFLLYKLSAQIPFYMIVRFREAIVPLLLLIATLPVAKLMARWEKKQEG